MITQETLMRSWEPEVGQRLPLVDYLDGRVLQLGPADITLGFVGTDPSRFASWASRQRKTGAYFCTSNGETPMLVMNCRAGQVIDVDERAELRIEQQNDSSLRISMVDKPDQRGRRMIPTEDRFVATDFTPPAGYWNWYGEDEALARRVVNFLQSRRIPGIDGIRVTASNGTVTLSGRLPRNAHYLATECCRHVAGVLRMVYDVADADSAELSLRQVSD